MIAAITMYPYNPWRISTGLTVFQFANVHVFSMLARGLREELDEIVVSDDDKPQSPTKLAWYIGDLACGVNVDALFLREYMKACIDSFSEENMHDIHMLISELNSHVQGSIWSFDYPLSTTTDFSIKNVLSFFKPQLDYEESNSLFDNLMSIVNLAAALPNTKALVTLHTTEYCSDDQLKSLNSTLIERDLQVIDIERIDQRRIVAGVRDYFVDEDFVQFS